MSGAEHLRMMKTVAEVLESKEGEEVELFGWIWNKREHGKLVFVDLREGTGVVQVAANACMPLNGSARRNLSRRKSASCSGFFSWREIRLP